MCLGLSSFIAWTVRARTANHQKRGRDETGFYYAHETHQQSLVPLSWLSIYRLLSKPHMCARPTSMATRVALAISGKVHPWLLRNIEGNSPTAHTAVFWHWHKDDALATCT